MFYAHMPIHESSDIDLAIVGGDIIEATKLSLHSDVRVDVVDNTNQDDSIDGFGLFIRIHPQLTLCHRRRIIQMKGGCPVSTEKASEHNVDLKGIDAGYHADLQTEFARSLAETGSLRRVA